MSSRPLMACDACDAVSRYDPVCTHISTTWVNSRPAYLGGKSTSRTRTGGTGMSRYGSP